MNSIEKKQYRKINCKNFKDKKYCACENSKTCYGDMCSCKNKYDNNEPIKCF